MTLIDANATASEPNIVVITGAPNAEALVIAATTVMPEIALEPLIRGCVQGGWNLGDNFKTKESGHHQHEKIDHYHGRSP
jgi:hypothetical protein